MLARMWSNKALIHCWWECRVVQPQGKMVWRFLTKVNIVLPYVSAVPLLGIHPDELKIYPHKNFS